MKLIIIIAIAFVLLIPSPIFAPSHPEYVGFEPPLKQIFHGVAAEAVKCNGTLELFIKNNGSPVCVKPTTVSSATNFEQCIAEGNPAMESHPRQCRTIDGKHFVESISENKECEINGGVWGVWGNAFPIEESCNLSTLDAGVECTDSSQCQSFCQAKEGSEINSETTGMCYGYELAICIQTVEDGVVQNELCQ